MAGKLSKHGSELLDMIEAIIDEESAKGLGRLGRRITQRMAIECGGQSVYFPSDKVRRDEKLFDEYTGDNAPELALQYRISVQTVYQIIRAERARRRMKQAMLPGLGIHKAEES